MSLGMRDYKRNNKKENNMDLRNLLNNVEAEQSRENKNYLPAGDYNVVIEKIEPRKNETGWAALNFQLRIFGKDFNNAVLFDMVTIAHATNQKPVEIGLKRIKKIAELCETENTQEMLGKKVRAVVGVVDDAYKVQLGETDAKKNVIWEFDEVEAQDNTPLASATNAASTIFNADSIPF